jgi:hypothetical protein
VKLWPKPGIRVGGYERIAMRIASIAALPLVGVGLTLGLALTFTPACGSGGVTCQNATPMQQSCLDCVNSSCSSDVTAVETNCPDYLSCESACNCGDSSCGTQCLKGAADAGSACAGAGTGYLDCLTKMCASQCAGFEG